MVVHRSLLAHTYQDPRAGCILSQFRVFRNARKRDETSMDARRWLAGSGNFICEKPVCFPEDALSSLFIC